MSAESACWIGPALSRTAWPAILAVRHPAGCDRRLAAVPGFWAKWQLVMSLAAGERYVWIAIVLVGSLLEAAYLFRWFGQVVHSSAKAGRSRREVGCASAGVRGGRAATVTGCFAADPRRNRLAVGVRAARRGLRALSARPAGRARDKALIALAVVSAGGLWLIHDLSGINCLFAALLLAGGLVVAIACL